MFPRFSWFEVERTHRRRPYHSNTCKQAASPKPKGFLLAGTLQA